MRFVRLNQSNHCNSQRFNQQTALGTGPALITRLALRRLRRKPEKFTDIRSEGERSGVAGLHRLRLYPAGRRRPSGRLGGHDVAVELLLEQNRMQYSESVDGRRNRSDWHGPEKVGVERLVGALASV